MFPSDALFFLLLPKPPQSQQAQTRLSCPLACKSDSICVALLFLLFFSNFALCVNAILLAQKNVANSRLNFAAVNALLLLLLLLLCSVALLSDCILLHGNVSSFSLL